MAEEGLEPIMPGSRAPDVQVCKVSLPSDHFTVKAGMVGAMSVDSFQAREGCL